MAGQLEFAEDFPQLLPDPPQAHVQFSVKWKCENTGDEPTPEAGVQIDVLDSSGNPLLTSIGRNVAALSPGQTDEDTVGVGAVGSGSGTVRVTINGLVATIPITVN
ncbi:hypothetical protein Rhe02_20250 [Rhizocola hellebori]|uniref:Uncharacterized protein n=1 Tax=Rhizocola hellebori TaxID=1392758 RepID=A0A8J3VFJ9_9ACTN|nr:hypothetical protein [Rhizocola hellebori]GIH03958.1 hypothetical protein Rhe02_20250 [Rhizocola hellebori]